MSNEKKIMNIQTQITALRLELQTAKQLLKTAEKVKDEKLRELVLETISELEEEISKL